MKLILLTAFVFLSSCGTTQSAFKRSEITPQVLKDNFIDKPYAVRIRFYISKSEMLEETGYIKKSDKENTIVFEYFDAIDHKYNNVEIPLSNISSIAIASEDSRSFSFRKEIGFLLLTVGLLTILSFLVLQ